MHFTTVIVYSTSLYSEKIYKMLSACETKDQKHITEKKTEKNSCVFAKIDKNPECHHKKK